LRLLSILEMFSGSHSWHLQEHETPVCLCFPSGGSQMWVSQEFRQDDMGKLHLISKLTLILWPQVFCPRCSCRSQDLAWWCPCRLVSYLWCLWILH
jgi:hypothetical protein